MAAGDLTTLSHVKDWLGIPDNQTASDAVLSRLITSASRFILGYLQRDSLAVTTYNEIYDGYGNNFMMLRQWPIINLTDIQFCGVTINTPSTGNPRTPGYILEPTNSVAGGQQRLTLWGYCFPRMKAAVMINYEAGYQVTGEAQTIPATPGPYTVTTNNVWLGDGGVTYTNGTPLTFVTTNPAQGQYSVPDGVYTFNAADQGQGILLTYSYVPADIEEATYEMVSERFKYKDRIGMNSKSLGGQETVSFSQKDMSDFVETLLNPYRRVVPV